MTSTTANGNIAASAQQPEEEAPTAAAAQAVPSNANTGCVGPTAESAGKVSSCEGCPNQSACSSGAFSSPEALQKAAAEVQALKESLHNVSNVILVISGKGGVGKSTVAAQLAHTLAAQNYAVGVLDVDLCGPSAPRMILGDAHTTHVVQKNDAAGTWTPVYAPCGNLAVMSISFMLQDHNQAVVWRGPRKNALIQQFLTQVDWTGDTQGLDYLLIDTPPGTSDEHISTVQYLQKANAVKGAIVVTTPEEVALADVRKELSFCSKTNVPVLGVIENMGTFTTPLSSLQFVDSATGQDATSTVLELLQTKCPEVLQNYQASCQLYGNNNNSTERGGGGGAEQMAHDYNVPFWGRLPLDPLLLQACEKGQAFCKQEPNAPATKALQDFCKRLTDNLPVDMDE